MKNNILIITLAIAFASCGGGEKQADAANTDSVAADTTMMRIQIPEATCYRYVSNNDTVALKVEKFPNVVTGNLSYALREKDRNNGEIDGILKGDTLVADYTFSSEGTRSVRQVIFLLQNDTATEGYGEMKEEGGKMIFKDMSKIDFTKGLKLQKVSCSE